SELTQTGTAPGSPGYMSPEQIRSGDVDGRSDLFSLAVVLYEALCGRRPFRGDDLVALTWSITNETQVPLSRHMKNCSAALDRLFDRALSKDPAKRFPDAASLRDALEAAARAGPDDASEGTVVEPVNALTTPLGLTVPLPPGARPPGEVSRHVAAPEMKTGHGRRLVPWAAAGTALAVAACVVTWMELGRPDPLHALGRPGVPSHAEP